MTDYSSYVWAAFAVTALVLGGLAVSSALAYRSTQRELRQLQEDDHAA
jgi:heme exporter protein CcmD